MSEVLYIAEAVVTGEQLRRLHQGEAEVCFSPKTVVTPTAWDYLRERRLRVSRGEPPAAPVADPNPGTPLIREVPPPQWTAEGRCDHPDRSFGCQTEEFGSGFAEPSSCQDCSLYPQKREGRDNPDCKGCNRQQTPAAVGQRQEELEALVQRITELVVEELARAR